VLVDKRQSTSSGTYKVLTRILGDRLFTLDATTLEEYLPGELYTRCGRYKDEDLKAIAKTKNHTQKAILKMEIAKAIAQVLTQEGIKDLSIIADAIDKANV